MPFESTKIGPRSGTVCGLARTFGAGGAYILHLKHALVLVITRYEYEGALPRLKTGSDPLGQDERVHLRRSGPHGPHHRTPSRPDDGPGDLERTARMLVGQPAHLADGVRK